MSPHNKDQQSYQAAEHSPWTEAFQTNPMHQMGSYDTQPVPDDAQAPTWHALEAIYNPTER